jgi:cyclophilin family peptidyl-prolyl cis-trans isomerase
MLAAASTFVRAVAITVLTTSCWASADEGTVQPIPNSLRESRRLADFYQKQLVTDGFLILGSEKVSDAALLEAAWILGQMLEGRRDILDALDAKQVHLTVMAWNEYTTDVPEHKHLQPRVFWDRRARGLGGSPVSCGEENLLGHPGDPYSTENLLIHEFSHAVHGIAMQSLDPTFDTRLKAAFESARQKGLWNGTYAGQNRDEYWAEGAQDWFDNNRENDALHNHVNTRDELKEYDPALAKLCSEVFGDRPWRYHKPAERPESERQHLAGRLPAELPRFRWRDEATPEKPRVLIQTEQGEIELELDAQHAPTTVQNFLAYVHDGVYNDGRFFRTVTLANQPTDAVKIEVIQAQADPAKDSQLRPAIPLERTRDTGLKHEDGTVSMARLGPDTAQDHFFICVGAHPELDFGGKRNPDGQGFAAFGRVVKGMDVVRRIHAAPADGQTLQSPVRIQRAIRLN